MSDLNSLQDALGEDLLFRFCFWKMVGSYGRSLNHSLEEGCRIQVIFSFQLFPGHEVRVCATTLPIHSGTPTGDPDPWDVPGQQPPKQPQ